MSGFVKALLFFVDLVAINLCIYLSFQWNGRSELLFEADGIYLIAFSNITWLFLVMISTPYNVTKGWSMSKIFKSQSSFIFIHLLVVIALVIFFNRHYPVFQVLLIYLMFFPAFFISRIATFYFRRLFVSEIVTTNFILIGHNELSSSIRKYFLMNPQEGRRFQGYFDIEDLSTDALGEKCTSSNVHEIYCCVDDVDQETLRKLIHFGLDSLIKVRMVVKDHLADSKLLYLDNFDNLPSVDVAAVALDESRNQVIKRIFDIVFSFLFIVLVLSWVIPIIGLLIKLDSPGPIFFAQNRNGKGNKLFLCLKFRSMVANQAADNVAATRSDSRITKLGKFLRKSSIDELPQFINVLKGDMSLIGPRPMPPKFNERFTAMGIANLMSRHYVKPGITGLAQCMGYRGEIEGFADLENRFRLDRYYIENWTFWLDIKIIFLTVISLIRGSDKAF